MNWIKAIFKWLGAGSPKKENVTFTEDAKWYTYDEAMLMVQEGWEVRHRDWKHGKCITNRDIYIPTTAEQYGGQNWQTCGKVEQ